MYFLIHSIVDNIV